MFSHERLNGLPFQLHSKSLLKSKSQMLIDFVIVVIQFSPNLSLN